MRIDGRTHVRSRSYAVPVSTVRPGRCVCPRRCVCVQNIFLVLCFYTWPPDVKLLILTVIIILCLIQRRNSTLRKTCISENSSTKTWSLYNTERQGPQFGLKTINHIKLGFHQEHEASNAIYAKSYSSNTSFSWGRDGSYGEPWAHFLYGRPPKLQPVLTYVLTQLYHPPTHQIGILFTA